LRPGVLPHHKKTKQKKKKKNLSPTNLVYFKCVLKVEKK
jgi:hypothetical protein